MEIIDPILEWINNQSNFMQNIIAAVFILITSKILQVLYAKAKESGHVAVTEFIRDDVRRHLLFRRFVRSDDPNVAVLGITTAIIQALRWILIAFLILIFFIGVDSIVSGNWIYALASWFALNSFFMAFKWLRDTSSLDDISHVPDEIVDEVYDSFGIERKETDMDKVES